MGNQRGRLVASFTILRDFACFRQIGHHHEGIVGVRNLIQASDSYRHARPRLFDGLPQIVVKRANAAVCGADQVDIAAMERTLADEERRVDAFLFARLCFEAGAGSRLVRVGLQLAQFGHDREHVEQFFDALAGGSARVDERHIAAHRVRDQTEAVQLLFGLFDIGVGQVHLVDGNDD